MHKVKVYFLDTDGLSYKKVYDRYFCLIEEDRKSRIEKCANARSKEMLLYTGAALVEVLGGYGVSTSDLDRDEHGKPFVAGREDIFFNLSHSGKYIAVAVADGPVGIDIQKPVKAREALVKRITSEQERERYKDLIEERFNLFWAVKESYSKLTGEGIGMDFKRIAFSESTDKILRLLVGGASNSSSPIYAQNPMTFGVVLYPNPEYPTVVTMFEEFEFERSDIWTVQTSYN